MFSADINVMCLSGHKMSIENINYLTVTAIRHNWEQTLQIHQLLTCEHESPPRQSINVRDGQTGATYLHCLPRSGCCLHLQILQI